jgi:apolipoprotein N-acyltransferase
VTNQGPVKMLPINRLRVRLGRGLILAEGNLSGDGAAVTSTSLIETGKTTAGTHVGPLALRPLGGEFLRVLFPYTLSIIALTLIFQPLNWWPLAFVGLAPWAIATCRTDRAWLAHWLSFLGGWVFFLINLKWLNPVTGLGFVALGFYLAIYWVLAAWALRTARRLGMSPIFSLPVIWVACEYLRAFVMSGFPWLFISHSFADVLPLIQIADLGGAYAVTFVAAMTSGVIAEVWLWNRRKLPDRRRTGQMIFGMLMLVVLLAATLLYGRWRLGQESQFTPGPRLAILQEDFPLLNKPPYSESPIVILGSYLQLAAQAAVEEPDLLIFPETAWSGTQNKEFVEGKRPVIDSRRIFQEWKWGQFFHRLVQEFCRGNYELVRLLLAAQKCEIEIADSGPPMRALVGAKSIEIFPEQTYPRSRQYNSALFYEPESQRDERYDKMHLVPFGEAVPFRFGRFHWLYRMLNRLSPFSQGGQYDYSLTPGSEPTVFDLETADKVWRFGVPICYEDAMPYVVRRFAWDGSQRRVDFLINISNDGWFLHSEELPQHLAICVFRAVENRVSIVRSVNTGISGFIDGNGRKSNLIVGEDGSHFRWETDAQGKRVRRGYVGYRVDHVAIDARTSWYGQHGDWFAGACPADIAALVGSGICTLGGCGTQSIAHLAAWSRDGK